MNPNISKCFDFDGNKTGSKKTFKEKLEMFKEIDNNSSKSQIKNEKKEKNEIITKKEKIDGKNEGGIYLQKNKIENKKSEELIKFTKEEKMNEEKGKIEKSKLDMFEKMKNDLLISDFVKEELEKKKKENDRMNFVKVRGTKIKTPSSWVDRNIYNFSDLLKYLKKAISNSDLKKFFSKEEDEAEMIKLMCIEHKTLDPNEILVKLIDVLIAGKKLRNDG
jgi:hypothetical protein